MGRVVAIDWRFYDRRMYAPTNGMVDRSVTQSLVNCLALIRDEHSQKVRSWK